MPSSSLLSGWHTTSGSHRSATTASTAASTTLATIVVVVSTTVVGAAIVASLTAIVARTAGTTARSALPLALSTGVLTTVLRPVLGLTAPVSVAARVVTTASVVLGLLTVMRRSALAWASSPSAAILAIRAVVTTHRRAAAIAVSTAHAASAIVIATLAIATTTATSSIAVSTAVVASTASAAAILATEVIVALRVLLDLALVDGRLVADIVHIASLLAQSDFEHRDDARELKVVEALLKRLVLVNNRDVADLVELVKALDAVLDQLSELDGALDGVGHALNHDVVGLTHGLLTVGAWGGVQELVSALQVAADADATLDADLVGWKHLLGLLNAHVLVSHGVK